MSRDSGAEHPKVLRWTRAGFVPGSWGPYETFESLVFPVDLQERLQKLALGFMGAQDFCAKAKIPWRKGAFLFGPPGTGKTAATRAAALLMSWRHITIPAHEILDTHLLTRALAEVTSATKLPAVVVIENIDEILRRMDTKDFFDIFDLASDRADGVFWFATTRHPEEVPKVQLLRPGRFEESLRLVNPGADVKKKYYETYLEPFMQADVASVKVEHIATLEANENLSFAHLQEMRLLIAKVLMDGDPDRIIPEFQGFAQLQIIEFDRWGGPSALNNELGERVKKTDPRLLVSALDVTDAFKRVVELTISNVSEALHAASPDGKE